jgi:fructose-bisphosphate aldolase class II
LVSLRTILDHAAEYDYGLPAFNVTNMETMLGVMRAADATDSPVILQATRSARKFAGDIMLSHLVRAAVETWPHLPICMHQDHGNNLETCQQAIDLGFSSVMMDGSLEEDGKTPASHDYNTRVTAAVVKAAHAVGVSVEGEIGCLGSLETGAGDQEDGHGFEGTLDKSKLVTDPDEAAVFVRETDFDPRPRRQARAARGPAPGASSIAARRAPTSSVVRHRFRDRGAEQRSSSRPCP